MAKAIKSIILQVNSLTKINFKVDIDNLFSIENEINIFRITQEGAGNIIKHFEAFKAELDTTKKQKEKKCQKEN